MCPKSKSLNQSRTSTQEIVTHTWFCTILRIRGIIIYSIFARWFFCSTKGSKDFFGRIFIMLSFVSNGGGGGGVGEYGCDSLRVWHIVQHPRIFEFFFGVIKIKKCVGAAIIGEVFAIVENFKKFKIFWIWNEIQKFQKLQIWGGCVLQQHGQGNVNSNETSC